MRKSRKSTGAADATTARVLDALRQGARTVDEVAERLAMTRAGARLHLTGLQREGLVQLAGRRAGVRKPFNEYALTPLGEQALSRAYLPVLRALVATLGETLSAEQARQLFSQVGGALARDTPRPRPGTPAHASATEVLEQLGGSVRMTATGELVRLDGNGCPLAELVRAQPITCEAVRSLLEGVTARPVRQCCTHGAHPACGFEFRR